MRYIITTAKDKVLVEAPDRDHAFAKYFHDVVTQKVPIEKLGCIILLHDGKEKYGFRTAPLLWKMGIIGMKHAIDSIVGVTGATRAEAKDILKTAASADARLIPLIEELELKS